MMMMTIFLQDGSNSFLRDVGKFLPDYLVSHPILSCYCQVLLFIIIQEAIEYGLITCARRTYTQWYMTSSSLLYGFVTAYILTIPNRQVYRHIHKIVKSDY
jgi:hypothetical protein